ncbi:30S ribosomal protein S1 [Treponema parvum]|uniref:30S ribosomal protein S1 n=1 Tax=Treponema parvum TaxID=138851 RepID=UPI00211DE033|nr:S1 RNA-binding domain-containing protein [Treponema parvum]
MNEADLEKYEQRNLKKLSPGQEISTAVAAISGDTVFLDLNAKSEGILDAAELKDKEGNLTVKEGDVIKVFYIGLKDGEMQFTTKIAGDKADNSLLENAYKNGIPVEGYVEKEINGGFEVKIGNSRAFCPYSQMGFRQKAEPSEFTGKNLTFMILEFKDGGKNLLVSNRKILEKEHEKKLEDLSQTLKCGMTVTGKVTALHDYGAFVDIDGFQALLPISEISLDRISDINSVLKAGQEIKAEIIKTDWKNERISLSIKSLLADPWEDAAKKYPAESKHEGVISRIADFGLFVNLEPGIDGLIHISALENVERNSNLKKLYKTGTKMSVSVKSVDTVNRRIALLPTTSTEQDKTAAKYMDSQSSDGESYNPFAALLKK